MIDIENDILLIVDAAVKDKVSTDIIAAVRSKYLELQDTKTQCKRAEKTAIIRLKAWFDIRLSAFEAEYRRLKESNVTIPEVDRYIADMKGYVDQLSIEKNKS